MILADTSVWIDHFRNGNSTLIEHLSVSAVLMHPFVLGELACGNLKERYKTLGYFTALPSAKPATHDEVLQMVSGRRLWSLGIGWIDAHLLASAMLSECRLWTLDKRLRRAGEAAGATLMAAD